MIVVCRFDRMQGETYGNQKGSRALEGGLGRGHGRQTVTAVTFPRLRTCQPNARSSVQEGVKRKKTIPVAIETTRQGGRVMKKALIALIALALVSPVLAQDRPEDGPGDGPPPGVRAAQIRPNGPAYRQTRSTSLSRSNRPGPEPIGAEVVGRARGWPAAR